LTEPRADAGDHVGSARALAQGRGERIDRRRSVAEDDVLLRREVAEHRRARDVGPFGDVVDRGAREALVGEQCHAGLVDRGARRALLTFSQAGHNSSNYNTPSNFQLS
jgi:hypothetical protein